MKYLITLILIGAVLTCNTKKGRGESQKRPPANAQTKIFCENIRHFESFYVSQTSIWIGLENSPEPPSLWEMMPNLAPDRLPDSKALEIAIDKDCRNRPTGNCKVFENTCSEEEKKIKTDMVNCIYQKVQTFKKAKCPHLPAD